MSIGVVRPQDCPPELDQEAVDVGLDDLYLYDQGTNVLSSSHPPCLCFLLPPFLLGGETESPIVASAHRGLERQSRRPGDESGISEQQEKEKDAQARKLPRVVA